MIDDGYTDMKNRSQEVTMPDALRKEVIVERYTIEDGASEDAKWDPRGDWVLYSKHAEALAASEARVAALEAERDRLREALAPIWEQVKTDAKYGDYIEFGEVDAQLDGKMLEAIRQALNPAKES